MLKLTPMDDNHLEQVLAWRNHPDVRKNMYTTHVISYEEHAAWFLKIKHDPSYAYFIAYADIVPMGVIAFSDINPVDKSASWAFYAAQPVLLKAGSLLEFYALEYAFQTLQLEHLRCEVLSFNNSVIKLHQRFGFIAQDAFLNNGQHQVVHLTITRTTWSEYRAVIAKKLKITL
ncbi:MAG: UDP-4-amino-4,6-dideoxy-N-acetyl-beta-L-altrosamine N-acetyltransferase [Plesiomonas sp.]|uniref:UDP-4-amino-4, 6-dideoxy-N-acetyl-beta-L-altrosamine N-acetyltransferase n=1 Tax=Plesiomonas sp. TaxID=2486279 RepID=UPI003F3BAB18